MKSLNFFILITCLLFLPGTTLAMSASNKKNQPKAEFYENEHKKVFGIPLLEAENLIYDWLSDKGFMARRIKEDTGRIKIIGTKDNEQWRIFLESRSPLATQFNADYTCKGISDTGKVQELKERIIRQIEGPEIIGDNDKAYIPSVVLSRIESVVCLESIVKGETIQFSGFVVDTEGLVLSTAHDLKGHQKLNIILFDGSKASGQVIKADHKRDLALIRVEVNFSAHVSLEEGRNFLGMGEQLYSVGCPVNLRGTVFSGFINGPPRRVEDQTFWQVNMRIHPGSSGSPVFDSQGNLVAIVKGRFRGTESLGFLIPFETIVSFAREIRPQ